jgi:hypothetical protein
LLECFLDSFREWLSRPEAEEMIGMAPEIAAWFFDRRRNEFRARFQPSIDRAFETWAIAARANGGLAN